MNTAVYKLEHQLYSFHVQSRPKSNGLNSYEPAQLVIHSFPTLDFVGYGLFQILGGARGRKTIGTQNWPSKSTMPGNLVQVTGGWFSGPGGTAGSQAKGPDYDIWKTSVK